MICVEVVTIIVVGLSTATTLVWLFGIREMLHLDDKSSHLADNSKLQKKDP